MTTVLSSKGQIVIPSEIRARRFLKPGDQLEIEETETGILLRKAGREKAKVVEKNGLLVLRAAKGAPTITSAMVKKLESELL
jgi:AbrB family looped-hinge helix DNA binding protein